MSRRRATAAGVVDAFLLATAANDEAERLGHPEVSTDHLLLGLIAMGGAAAGELRRHGVTLARARLAVAEVQRRDLRTLGITAPDTSLPPPLRYAPDLKPLTPAAAEIAFADLADGPAVLRRLLVDRDGPPARVLAELGVGVDDLDLAGVVTTQDGPAPFGAWQSTHSVLTPVARERLWALLDDPHRRPGWDTDVHTVIVVDDEHVVTRPALFDDSRVARRILKGVSLEAHHHLTVREVGHVLQWRTVFPRRGHVEHLRIELADDPAGTRLTLSHRDERRGNGPASRLLRWMSAAHLRLRAQAITQAAS